LLIYARVVLGTLAAAAVASAQVLAGGTVTGQPFSAQQETERIQTLIDGTRIAQPLEKITYFRDSQGRTRTEHTPPVPPGLEPAAVPATRISIEDPVAGYRFSFESNGQSAQRMPMHSSRSAVTKPPAVTTPPETSREQLGTQIIEGVTAQGVRITITWPAGSLGNDRPITSVRETWTSRELGMAVLIKSSDPRFGETTTKLTNLLRAEPAPWLFQPPAGYDVIDPGAAPQK
jgi:hypothetical protein